MRQQELQSGISPPRKGTGGQWTKWDDEREEKTSRMRKYFMKLIYFKEIVICFSDISSNLRTFGTFQKHFPLHIQNIYTFNVNSYLIQLLSYYLIKRHKLLLFFPIKCMVLLFQFEFPWLFCLSKVSMPPKQFQCAWLNDGRKTKLQWKGGSSRIWIVLLSWWLISWWWNECEKEIENKTTDTHTHT